MSFQDGILSFLHQNQLFIQEHDFPTVILVVRISVQKQCYGLLGIAEELWPFHSLFSKQYFHPSMQPSFNFSRLVGSQQDGINGVEIT